MAILADLETAIVQRIAGTQLSGSPLFESVAGVSGGFRPVVRALLLRERMPAAAVGFTEEATAPDTTASRRGPRFSVFVAARSLRVTGNPRIDDEGTIGAFTLIAELRSRLDNYVTTGHKAIAVQVRFADADERVAIYELAYRLQPVTSAPTFDGTQLGGSDSVTTRELGPPDPPARLVLTKQGDGTYEVSDGPALETWDPASMMVWEGEFWGATAAAVDSKVSEVADFQTAGGEATLLVPGVVEVTGVSIREYRMLTPMVKELGSGKYRQALQIVFERKA